MADYVDLSLHGVVAEDIDRPPLVVHLHGAPNSPVDDGYPTAIIRPGQYIDYTFGNDLEAAPLWYHDHSMGSTRLSLYAGLAAPYWVRDEWDTGEDDNPLGFPAGEYDNPLGLPAGEYEVPLVISDKIFTREGRLRYDSVRTNILQHHWNGGLSGDVMVVNGKAWPNMMVDKGIYRLRLTSTTSINDYRFGFSNGMPFWVIGSDAGLLDKPVKVAALDVSSAERYDLLVDFTQFEEGDQAELYNLVQIAWIGQLGGNAWVRDVMRFTGTGKPGRYTRIPDTLRGAKKQPKALPPLATPTEPPITHTMNLNLNREGEWIARVNMNIDNLDFDAPEVDIARAGGVEQWNLVNADVSLETHSIHIHLAHMRVLGRQDFDRRRYVHELDSPGHIGDRRWAPSAEDYVQGPLEPPAPYETGWKDTVRCPRGQITRVIIQWPTAEELGFDPDAPFSAPDGTQLQGYVWHCHMLDHEDNVMMRRIRVVDGSQPAVSAPDLPMPMPMPGHYH
jgi:FtsP/CotA-like multicopper oxidase with cupredoxin domain